MIVLIIAQTEIMLGIVLILVVHESNKAILHSKGNIHLKNSSNQYLFHPNGHAYKLLKHHNLTNMSSWLYCRNVGSSWIFVASTISRNIQNKNISLVWGQNVNKLHWMGTYTLYLRNLLLSYSQNDNEIIMAPTAHANYSLRPESK